MSKVYYEFITINEINGTLIANIALQLQKYIQLNLKGEYADNFIVCKFTPKTQPELQNIFELNETLKQANYTPTIFALIDKNKDLTPYYLKIEWPIVNKEN